MHESLNKPIFVVGSPRSGTSILTWCLGQHPNIFVVPESNWMTVFAVNVAISHQIGVARGRFSLLSAMEVSRDEFFAAFGRSINELIRRHRPDLDRNRKMITSDSEPKRRWVDGTPEYSLIIYALRKLFPEALFVHILRDVRDVVRSMLNFHRVAGIELVANEQAAYQYWLRIVRACVRAEQAYGPRVIHRLEYSAFIDDPESSMRRLLGFLGEPYNAKCLEPLRRRINSSNVPADFVAKDTSTDPAIVAEAVELYRELQNTKPSETSAIAAQLMENEFEQRVQYVASLKHVFPECGPFVISDAKGTETVSAPKLKSDRI